MAEVLAVVGAAAGFAQLASQIIRSVKTISSIIHQVKDAPSHVSSLLEEIDTTSQLLKSLAENGEGDEVTLRSLRSAKGILDELQELLERLDGGVRERGWKGRVKWGSLRVVGKEQVIRGMVERLERAKSSLNGALLHHLMSVQRQHTTVLEKQTSMLTLMVNADMQIIIHTDQEKNISKPRSESSIKPSVGGSRRSNLERSRRKTSMDIVTRWYGIGWVQTTYSRYNQEEKDRYSSETVAIRRQFLPAAWLRLPGISVSQTRLHSVYGQWTYVFTPIYVVPSASPVFEACEAGDVDEVQRLLDAGKATIHDTNENGWTLLHVAAAHLRPNLCRKLISLGVRTDGTESRMGGTALHLAAMCSGRYGDSDYAPLDGGKLKRSFDNDFRVKDCLETIRILVEEGQCDPMAKTSGDRVWWPDGSTPLHMFTGPTESFKYLLTQEQFVLDLNSRNDRDLSVSASQLIFRWPYAAGNARLSMHAAGDLNQIAKQNRIPISHSATSLNMVVSYVQESQNRYRDKAPKHPRRRPEVMSKAQMIESSEFVIADLLEAGADIHAADGRGATPLSILTYNQWSYSKDFGGDFIERILLWFRLLRKAGHDLQRYISKEAQVNPDIQSMFAEYCPSKSFWKHCYPGCQALHKASRDGSRRTMVIERRHETDDCLIRFKDIYTTADVEGVHPLEQMPGSWDPSIEVRVVEKSRDVSEIIFFIGPLINGVQDYGIWKGLTKIELWADTNLVEIQEMEMEDV